MRYNIPFLVLGAPIVVALIWGFLAYQVIILGRFVQFSVFIMPFSIILLVIYLMGMIFWYKIESTGVPLGKLPVDIRFGAATGADKVFLLKNAEDLDSKTMLAVSRFLADVFVFESSILRPILRGRHLVVRRPSAEVLHNRKRIWSSVQKPTFRRTLK